jgi:hypothetical protein
MSGWLVVSLFAIPVIVLASARNRSRRTALRVSTVELSLDEFGVRRQLADGRTEAVDWNEITEVAVLTARTGPYRESGGVVILAGDLERGCLVPIDQVADSSLLERLQQLPGFDVNRFAQALLEKPPRRTTCWERVDPPDGRSR